MMNARELVLSIKKRGLSSLQISQEIGCSVTYIVKISNGTRKNPSYKIMDSLRQLSKRV